MEKRPKGISDIYQTDQSFGFLYSGGAARIPIGTPAYNAFFDVLEVAAMTRIQKLRVKQDRRLRRSQTVAAAQPTPGAAVRGLDRVVDRANEFWAAISRALSLPRPSAPSALRVRHAPFHRAEQAIPEEEIIGQGLRPPKATAFSETPTGRMLVVGEQPQNSAQTLILNNWRIRVGKEGYFVRGQITGHAHFPDGSVVETPYLKAYHPECNLFEIADGSFAALGIVDRGVEDEQSQRLARAHRLLAPEAGEARPEIPVAELKSISLENQRVRFRFGDKTAISVGLGEPLGLVFGALTRELQTENLEIDWGLPMEQKPTAAAAAQAPAEPAAEPEQRPEETGEPTKSFEELGPENSRPEAAHEPVADTSETFTARIITVHPPKDGGPDQFMFTVATKAGEKKMRASAKIATDIAAVVLAGAHQGDVEITSPAGDLERAGITNILDDKGKPMDAAELAKEADEIRARGAKAAAQNPLPVAEARPGAPRFLQIQPSSGPEIS